MTNVVGQYVEFQDQKVVIHTPAGPVEVRVTPYGLEVRDKWGDYPLGEVSRSGWRTVHGGDSAEVEPG